MKLYLKVVFVLQFVILSKGFAQTTNTSKIIEELKNYELKKGYLKDTAYFNLKNNLGFYYANNYPDSAILLLEGIPEQVQKIKYYRGEVETYKIIGTSYQTKGDFEEARKFFEISSQKAKEHNLDDLLAANESNIGITYINQGNYAEALGYFYKALKSAEKYQNDLVIGGIWNNIGTVHFFQNKIDESIRDYEKMLSIAIKGGDINGELIAYGNIGESYQEKKEYDKALVNFKYALDLAKKSKDVAMQISASKNLGSLYSKMDNPDLAISNLQFAYQLANESGNRPSMCKVLIELANNLEKKQDYELALEKAKSASNLANEMGQSQLIRDSNEVLSKIYQKTGDWQNALISYKRFKSYSDTINNIESEKAAIRLNAEFIYSKKELEYQKKVLQQRWLIFSGLAAFLTLCVIVWLVNRNRNRARRSNGLLRSQNEAINNQKLVLEDTLSQLKNTQKQLIQSEKMASLGELTAGIAHEIQNPLNFVNNFSKVSKELLDELKEELKNKNWEEVNAIIADVDGNLKIINEHGTRASNIVKGMLQHSRNSPGKSEITDINELTSSAAKLSYQGHLASNKTFNALFEIKLGENIPSISFVNQDISRVILNLTNNAFQAVEEKQLLDLEGYRPKIEVMTEKKNAQIHITIKDNGMGIPEEIKDKIFHPFFTTKPSGKGTGLGLSLAYDIAKAHGGEIKLNSVPGEGSEFVLIFNI
jgi:two-component system, NtrC family, sensor kinase